MVLFWEPSVFSGALIVTIVALANTDFIRSGDARTGTRLGGGEGEETDMPSPRLGGSGLAIIIGLVL